MEIRVRCDKQLFIGNRAHLGIIVCWLFVVLPSMEATFTLYTRRHQLAFVGDGSNKRIKCIFKHCDDRFVEIMKMLLWSGLWPWGTSRYGFTQSWVWCGWRFGYRRDSWAEEIGSLHPLVAWTGLRWMNNGGCPWVDLPQYLPLGENVGSPRLCEWRSYKKVQQRQG